MSQKVKDKIFAIAQAKPQYEGVTQGELEHKHGFSRKEIDTALKELEKEGKLTAVPMFFSPQGRK
jgi:predicted transcriptional regulator